MKVSVNHKIIDQLILIYKILSLSIIVVCSLGLITNYLTMMYITMGCFFYICCLTLSERNFSLYQIFLATFFVFLLSRVFFNCFDSYDLRTLNLMQHGLMTDETALKTLNVITLFLIGTSFAWLGTRKKQKVAKKQFDREPPKTYLITIAHYLYYIYIFLFVVKMGYIINAARTYGYLSLFNGTAADNVHYPFFLIGVETLCHTAEVGAVACGEDNSLCTA